MREIKCPDTVKPSDDLYYIFMAGGITDCPDWQSLVLEEIRLAESRSELLRESLANVRFYNPRRDSFDFNDPGASKFQIKWEFERLKSCNEVYFWFPAEGPCMITLLELGVALGSGKPMRVGRSPDYVRVFDVREQVGLFYPEMPIYTSLRHLYTKELYERTK